MNIRPLLFVLILPICPARAQLLPDHGTGLEVDAQTVALFRFEDPAATAFDSTPNSRNATVSGTTSGTGLFGTGRTFDGVDDRLEFGNVFNALSGSPEWTIEYFAKSADGVHAPYLQNGNHSAAWSFYPAGTGIQYGIKTSYSGNDWHVLTSVVSPAMDIAWHYYALTWKAGVAISVYRDGVLLGSTSIPYGNWGGTNSYGVWMDYDSYWTTYEGAGVVDDLRFSNVARTAEEIQTAYNLAMTGDASAARVPQLINYQGRVAVGTTNFQGTGQFKFALVDRLGTTTYWSNDGTSGIGNEPVAAVSLSVVNGLYSVLLGETTLTNMTAIPATVFAHPHVRLRVWFNDGVNGFQLLTPDQRIAAVGYALMAADVPDGVITAAKLAPGAVSVANLADGSITAVKLAAGAVVTASIADGTITAAKLAPGAVGTLETTGNDPLDLKVNGLRGLRLYDPGDSDDSGTESDGAPNLIGGAPGNSIAAGTVGSTIAGGGATSYFGTAFANSIAADFSFIGGGYGNGIQTGARFGFIGAGRFNGIQPDAIESVINGGINNVIQANAFRSAIGGGEGNTIQPNALYSTIAGGYLNSISGGYAFVAGGEGNAAGTKSFAGGHRAKATHSGSFVWADSTDADFATTSSNQFNVRAGGGARFETAGSGLVVDGVKMMTWTVVSGATQQAEANTGYIANNAAQVNITLPASPNVGDVVRVTGAGSGGWKILLHPSQSVIANGMSTQAVYWTARESIRSWYGVASSSNGEKLVAVARGDQIYTSTDSGVSWTPRDSNRVWWAVASSADGSKLIAAVSGFPGSIGGQIYTSSDSGATWTPRESNRYWTSVASSADGTKLVAVDSGELILSMGVYLGGQIYTSTDSGVSWTPRESSRSWLSVASSADGTKLVAADSAGQIYTSTDSGVNWTPRESNRTWLSVASSSDGTKLIAGSSGQIYTSIDSGVTWTPRETNRNWHSVACSADGIKMIAAVTSGKVYTSADSGVSWTDRTDIQYWTGVACSADGTKIVATANQIYTFDESNPAKNLFGAQATAIELQYIGSGQFLPLSYAGTITLSVQN